MGDIIYGEEQEMLRGLGLSQGQISEIESSPASQKPAGGGNFSEPIYGRLHYLKQNPRLYPDSEVTPAELTRILSLPHDPRSESIDHDVLSIIIRGAKSLLLKSGFETFDEILELCMTTPYKTLNAFLPVAPSVHKAGFSRAEILELLEVTKTKPSNIFSLSEPQNLIKAGYTPNDIIQICRDAPDNAGIRGFCTHINKLTPETLTLDEVKALILAGAHIHGLAENIQTYKKKEFSKPEMHSIAKTLDSLQIEELAKNIDKFKKAGFSNTEMIELTQALGSGGYQSIKVVADNAQKLKSSGLTHQELLSLTRYEATYSTKPSETPAGVLVKFELGTLKKLHGLPEETLKVLSKQLVNLDKANFTSTDIAGMACCKASDCATRITALGTSAQLFETAGFNKEQMLELFHGTSTQVIEGVVKNMPTLEKAGFTPAKIIESKNVLANIISLAEELHSIREPSISGTVPADSLKKQHR